LSEIINELIGLYNWWSGVMFSLQFLAFIVFLNQNYVPTPQNAITYAITLVGFLLLNAVVSAIEGFVIGKVIDIIRNIF
jgi:hypothetical protein